MESKLLYIFNDLAKKNNIAIRFSFRFFITVLQNKKRKENDTLKIRLEFFPQIWLSEYANWDILALSPLIWVSGVRRLVLSPLIWVSGGKEFAVFNVCKWTISIVYARGLSPFLVGTQVCVCVR